MTAHLLQLAVGPVQEFIAAARRTRDLWFGSYVLSEISKAAALAVKAQGGKLIFPFPRNDAELEEGSELNVANLILAELPSSSVPGDVAKQARTAAVKRWQEGFAGPVHEAYQGAIRKSVWDSQVGDVIEFYSAWVAYDPNHTGPEHYRTQRQRLARLLAGRKNCRDFAPANGRDEGVPKSSLDGLRETVLKDERVESWPARTRRRLRVRKGEQLDVVGLVKRTASDDEESPVKHRHYPSVSRIAADPWLRGVAKTDEGKQRLAAFQAVCDALSRQRLLNRIDTERYPRFKSFPFEGSAVYRTRHEELQQETLEKGDSTEAFDQLRAALAEVERCAKQLGHGAEPGPYAAILVADGDRMGKAISWLLTPGEHQTFSKELATFAGAAAAVVREHHGVLVYSGGDDILALLPVDKCLLCARALEQLFRKSMRPALPARIDTKELPTLSVGVAIAHFLDNLEDLLKYGRDAEKHAKTEHPERNALAVHLHKRDAPVKVRKQWSENLDTRLTEYAGWFLDRAVSNRTPYELERLAVVYEAWSEENALRAAITSDAIRVIERKKPCGGGTTVEMKAIRQAVESRVAKACDLRDLAAELLIARQLATALRQSGGKKQ